MKKALGLLAVVFLMQGASEGKAANQITIESKSVAVGATGVQLGVFVDNDVAITAIVVPLELRELVAGSYVTSTAFSFGFTTTGRVRNSPLGPANPAGCDSDGDPSDCVWPAGNITSRRFQTPEAAAPCGGSSGNSWNASSSNIDGISPDATLFASVTTGDPGVGHQTSMPPGSDPAGTPSFQFTFNVSSVDGLFEIDTTCIKPANHLSFVQEPSTPVAPAFTKGVVTIGNPVFPPVVSDIPDQTIDEGQTFATINLDNYVSDLDDPDASLTWTASGQSQLLVTISPARVATISTPNPDWFGSETITFTASDGDGNNDSDPATFTVNPVNDPPVVANITNKIRLAGLPLSFAMTATDVDNPCGDISFSMVNAPGAATLTNDAPCGATFNWSTVCTDSGVYQVTFIATDGQDADSQVVQITIQPNPDRFDVTPDSLEFTFAVGLSEPAAQNLNVLDPGCGEMTFEVVVSDPWILVDPDTALTTAMLSVDIDTAGLAVGSYSGAITIRQIGVQPPVSILVPVSLEVTGVLCDCPCFAYPKLPCDSSFSIVNIVLIVNVAFRGHSEFGYKDCPVTPADVTCDYLVDIQDVVRIVDFIWRSGPPLCDPCALVTSQGPQ